MNTNDKQLIVITFFYHPFIVMQNVAVTNSKVSISSPGRKDGRLKLDISTSNGRLSCRIVHLEY